MPNSCESLHPMTVERLSHTHKLLPCSASYIFNETFTEVVSFAHAAGARSHKADAVTGMKAATESTLAKKSDAELKAEKEKQRAELEALRQRSAAATKAQKAEEAARQQTNKANIVAQYGQYDEVSESESESGGAVEDWELWGDPREVRALALLCIYIAIGRKTIVAAFTQKRKPLLQD